MSQKTKNTKKKFPAGKNNFKAGAKAKNQKLNSEAKGGFGAGKAKSPAQQKPSVPGEWLYMCEKELSMQELKQSFGADSSYDVEVWEEAGVLEIGWGEKCSFDMEKTEIHPKDEITAAYANERGVKSVFLATFSPEEYETSQKIMKTICDACGGFFCGDTENFLPVFPE